MDERDSVIKVVGDVHFWLIWYTQMHHVQRINCSRWTWQSMNRNDICYLNINIWSILAVICMWTISSPLLNLPSSPPPFIEYQQLVLANKYAWKKEAERLGGGQIYFENIFWNASIKINFRANCESEPLFLWFRIWILCKEKDKQNFFQFLSRSMMLNGHFKAKNFKKRFKKRQSQIAANNTRKAIRSKRIQFLSGHIPRNNNQIA